MRVLQFVDGLKYGDATGNFVIAISQMLDELGIENFIYTSVSDREIVKTTVPMNGHITIDNNDLIISHYTGFSGSINRLIFKDNTKILLYHNITPAHFFKNWSFRSFLYCKAGRSQLSVLPNIFDIAVSESTYNCDELKKAGFSKCFLLPIVVDKNGLLNHTYDMSVVNKYSDGFTNIIFVGRVAPNKKIEDLINVFESYKIKFNQHSRLIVVGATNEVPSYYDYLLNIVQDKDLGDSIQFTGKVSMETLFAWYRCANMFVTMSEHEGFCIPLVESMVFKIPVVAYSTGAVPEILGDGGVLVKEKDKSAIAKTIHDILSDKQYLSDLRIKQDKNIARFSQETFKENFQNILRIIEEENLKGHGNRINFLKNIKAYILMNIAGFNIVFILSSIIKKSVSFVKRKNHLL
jgi:glycosyltransferase involved in cell wall biosynthesis